MRREHLFSTPTEDNAEVCPPDKSQSEESLGLINRVVSNLRLTRTATVAERALFYMQARPGFGAVPALHSLGSRASHHVSRTAPRPVAAHGAVGLAGASKDLGNS